MVLSRVGNKYSLFIYKIWYQSFFNISTYECNYAHTFKIRNQMNRHYISIKVFFYEYILNWTNRHVASLIVKGTDSIKNSWQAKQIFFPKIVKILTRGGGGGEIYLFIVYFLFYIYFFQAVMFVRFIYMQLWYWMQNV